MDRLDGWKQTVHDNGVERTIDLDIIVIKRSQISREGNVGQTFCGVILKSYQSEQIYI